MGPRDHPEDRAAARDAHGRLAPLRAGRRPRRDPRVARPGGAAARRVRRAGPSRRASSMRTARRCASGRRRCASRGCACCRATTGSASTSPRRPCARLGFQTERRGKRLAVSIPLFRGDVRREDDLVEEVLRVYGYDRLPSRLPASSSPGIYKEPRRQAEERLADEAAASGLFETVNYPFVDRDADESAWGDWLRLTETALEPLAIVNPLDAARRHLRATLLPGLLDAVCAQPAPRGAGRRALRGRARLRGDGRIGPARSRTSRAGSPSRSRASCVRTGASPRRCGRRISSTPRVSSSGFSRRGSRRRSCPGRPFRSRPSRPRAAAARPHARRAGSSRVAGLVSGAERERRDLAVPVFAGEILVDALPLERPPFAFQAFSTRPPIFADLSFAQPRDLSWGAVEEFVRSLGLSDLEAVRCLDRYEGGAVAPGQVKTTIRLTFRSRERTLPQEEVNRQVQGLADALRRQLKVTFA